MALEDTSGTTGATGTAGDAVLPCGRSLSQVWDRPPQDAAHAGDCPHCQEALSRLGVLGEYVRQARAAPPAGAEEVTARVMDVVRAELRPGRPLPLGGPDEDAWIAESAAAKAFRRAAERLPGVQAGSCRVVPLDPEAARRLPLPGRPPYRGPLRVSVQLSVGTGWTVPDLAARVRRVVAEAAQHAVGMEIAEIDVSVIDIVEDEPEPEPLPGEPRTGVFRTGGSGTRPGGGRA